MISAPDEWNAVSESIPTPTAIDTIRATHESGGLALQSALHDLFNHEIIDSSLGQLTANAWWEAAAMSVQQPPFGPDDRQTARSLATDAAVASDHLTASIGSLQMYGMHPGMREQVAPVLRAGYQALSAILLVWEAANDAVQQ